MVAFAANSILCRLALDQGHIDAASFTMIRVSAGTLTLVLLLLPQLLANRTTPLAASAADTSLLALIKSHLAPTAAIALTAYLVFFSFAYVSLGTATGALILFGTVQFTMFCSALIAGERFSFIAWCGLAIAAAGVVYLLLPGVTAPDFFGTTLMIAAGIGWGVYSLKGRGTDNPLLATGVNFLLATPLVAAIAGISWLIVENPHLTPTGVSLAVASGALASGVGYAVWYSALRGLSAGSAAIIQLSVPVIAALGAALFVNEPITLRLMISAVAVLGGILLLLRN